jgi:hypothetical protein
MKRTSKWKERQAYEREWRAKNPERYREAQRRAYQARREEISAQSKKKWAERSPERIARDKSLRAAWHARQSPEVRERRRIASYEYQLRQKYGLSRAEYDEMWERQGQRCAICSRTKDDLLHRRYKMVVDHDHETGVVRGILCDDCNVGIARLREDIATIENAAAYLRNHANLRPALPDVRVA